MMKQQIIEALAAASDLSLAQIAGRVGRELDEIRDDLKALVQAGTVKMKEDPVEHLYLYRLSGTWARISLPPEAESH